MNQTNISIMKMVKILLPIAKLFPLNYSLPDKMEVAIGDLVIVNFRSKETIGIVWSLEEESAKYKLKSIIEKIFPVISLPPSLLQFIKKASNYYLCELGSIAKLSLPINLNFNIVDILHSPIKTYSFNLTNLDTQQQDALFQIQQNDKPIVIKGVTGSGKTEIYFHLVAEYIKQGKQCLIMLPEISLSSQIISRFIQRFGFEPIIWNSSITLAKKKKSLISVISGEAKIVIGARSSLFLPYKNISLIVVDEEHDSSYKQEDQILYNARDMAVLRGSLSEAKVILCSATPSIETIYNINNNKYHLINLNSRYGGASLPKVEVIDMKLQKTTINKWLSPILIKAIEQNITDKKQTLLFLNRKGYSPLLICRSCGYKFSCGSCTSWLVYHKSRDILECHHCGYKLKMLTNCPECQGVDCLAACGPGIERIEEEVKKLFPHNNCAVISKQQIKNHDETIILIEKIINGEIDILIGTQIISKGYHFPNLTLVGVVDADLGINEADLKATEKTFQLLHQVGGRAGRENTPGKLLLQTYQPNNILFDCLKHYQVEEFIKYELENRRKNEMPPFGKMAAIILSGKNEEKLFEFSKNLVRLAPKNNIRILGPVRALMTKIAGRYRYRILVICPKNFPLQNFLKAWILEIKSPANILIKIDIDPQTFV